MRRAWAKYSHELVSANWVDGTHRMQPAPAAVGWDIPYIESIGDFADWLGIDPGELFWFTDLKGLEYRTARPKLCHYHYRVLTKISGSLRLIEAPKHRLKDVQLQIMHCILENIPPHPSLPISKHRACTRPV